MKRIFLLGFLCLTLTVPKTTLSASPLSDSLLTGKSSTFLSTPDSLRTPLPVAEESNNPVLRVLWISFVLLVFLLAGMLVYKKYVLKGSVVRSTHIAVLARQTIAPKQSVLIVRIEDKKYALGATDHSLNMLADLGPVGDDEERKTENTNIVGFGDVLKKLIKRG